MNMLDLLHHKIPGAQHLDSITISTASHNQHGNDDTSQPT